MEPVSVRLAEQRDADALASVAAETFALACPPHVTEAAIKRFIADNLTAEHFATHLADPTRTLLIAEAGEPVGYALLVHADPYDADVRAVLTHLPTVELSKIYVRETAHGSGVAGLLLDAAVEVARRGGARGMWLGTNQDNARAQGFYVKRGFDRVGTKRFFVGDHYEDDFVFELAL